jgi:hypothetical protein
MAVVAWILLLPETRDDWISNASGHPLAEFVVGIEQREVNEAGSWAREERSDAVIKEVFKPRSPTVPPQVLECGNHPRRGERLARWRNTSKRVEPDRKFGVGDVEVAHLVCALGRHGVDNGFGKVAVRVDDGDPLAGINVVHGEIEQRCALAAA